MPKNYPKDIKEKVRYLRSQGWSLGEINLKLSIPKNTLSGWVKDITITEKQKERIEQKMAASAAKGRIAAARLLHERIELWKNGIRQRIRPFKNLALEDPQIGKIICGILYLCEGAKYPSSRYLYFGNSDPKIISYFLTLLRRYYAIEEGKLHFDICYRWDQNYEELKNFWSKVTKIPKSKFLRSKPDIRTKGKPTLKESYKGVGRVAYYSTDLQFELQAIGEAIISGAEGD
ncbi:MAG: hypothetical protein WCY12_03380 [Candidatus Omnitrophota bacterium]